MTAVPWCDTHSVSRSRLPDLSASIRLVAIPREPDAALVNVVKVKKCTAGAATSLKAGGSATANGNPKTALGTDGTLTLMNVDKKAAAARPQQGNSIRNGGHCQPLRADTD